MNSTLTPNVTLTTTEEVFIWDPEVQTSSVASGSTSQPDIQFLPDLPLFDNFSVEVVIVMWMAALLLMSSCCCFVIATMRFYYKRMTTEAINSIHEEFASGRVELINDKSDEWFMMPLRPLTPPFTEPASPGKKLATSAPSTRL